MGGNLGILPPGPSLKGAPEGPMTGADPESGKKGGTLLKKVEEQKKKKKGHNNNS